jgi:1,4-alpha-glucan branching enzyme
MKECVKGLNNLYRSEGALFDKQFSPEGFEWIDTSDRGNAVIVYARKGFNEKENLFVVLNFTPVPHSNYRIGIPAAGTYVEVFNSDKQEYWGSGALNGEVHTQAIASHGKENSIELTLPPLGAIVFKLK